MATLAVAIEGLVVFGYGVFLAVETVIAVATERLAAAVLALITLGLGAALIGAAQAMRRDRGWVRAPVIVWQILQLSVAVPAMTSTWWPLGLILIALSAVVIVAVVRAGPAQESRSD